MFCRKCGKELKPNVARCDQCGSTDFDFSQAVAEWAEPILDDSHTVIAQSIFYKSGNNMLRNEPINKLLAHVIKTYFDTHHISPKLDIPAIFHKRLRLVLFSSLLNIILLSLFFFHVYEYMYVLILANIVFTTVWFLLTDTKSYLIKQIKQRPNEKFAFIISDVLGTEAYRAKNKTTGRGVLFFLIIATSFLIPVIVFFQPRFYYGETAPNTYEVRYYSMGIINPDIIEVPTTYQGGSVTGLRGDVFRNIMTVRQVILPNSITYINGNAFSNAKNLETINLPSSLTYIGGGAFRDCKSLKAIYIPDSVTELRGEAFINCTSLSDVRLSKSLTEIRGNTFENCTSLTFIEIPAGVTRIGARAFYSCTSLRSVTIPDSMIELGSSSFRMCSSLYEISIPSTTAINERAFNESPTSIRFRKN